jgi:branched-chain amino acid transport system substrate-binding protein
MGGINGREIELLVRDTETDPGVATTRAQSLINDENVELMCGTFSSSVCLAVGPVASRNQVPYSAGYCATRRLTGPDCTGYAFRGTRNNAELQWMALGPYMSDELGYESASIMYADYAWGQSELEQFKRFFDGEVLSEVPVPAGTEDFSQYLSNVDTSGDALVYIQAGGDSINLLQQIENFGTHEEVEKIATTGAGIGEFLGEAGISPEVATSLLAVNWYPKNATGPLDTEANNEFQSIYSEYADEPLPTRSSSTGWEAIHLFRDIAEEIDYTGPDQAAEFVDTWRGFEMEESLAYPQGPKYYRPDNQAQVNQYITEVREDYTEEIIDTIPYDETDDYEITCPGEWIQGEG